MKQLSSERAHAGIATSPDVVVEVALAPSALDARQEMPRPNRSVYIVVDVVRATTSLVTQLEHGAGTVYVAPGIEEARAARQTLGAFNQSAGSVLLAGESGGLAPPGFDCGNSPAEFARLDLHGRDIVFATTNGTRALLACGGGAAILAGALRNASAVSSVAVALAARVADEDAPLDPLLRYTAVTASTGAASEAFVSPNSRARSAVVVVCSGRGRMPAYDDTLCAGIITERVLTDWRARGFSPRVGEGARIALATAAEAQRVGIQAALTASDAGQAVAQVGLGGDVEWCAAIDATDVVPYVTGTTSGGLLTVRRWDAPAK